MPPDINAIRGARAALRSIRRSLADAVFNVGVTQQALDAAERIYAENRPELGPIRTARDNAIGAAASLRSAERNARTGLHNTIKDWLQDVSVDTDLARMTTDAPLVLFPIRIETRFGVDGTQPVLRVRIFPDEIFINLHELAITGDEKAAGQDYYNRRDNGEDEADLWRELIQRMTPERAAYVLRLLTPDFSGGTSTGTASTSVGPEFPTDVPMKQSDFSRPAEAVLPDRWIVRAYTKSSFQEFVGNAIPEPLIMTPDPQKKTQTELFQIPGSNPPLFVDDEIAWTVDYQRAVDVGMAVTIPLTGTQATPGTGGFDKIIVFGAKTSFDQNDTVLFMEQLFDDHHYSRGVALVRQGTPTNNTEDEPTSLPVADPDGSISFNIERKPSAPTPISSQLQDSTLNAFDGGVLARILGVHSGLFSNVGGVRSHEQDLAASMATLLWPTTFGYVVEQLMAPLFNPTQHDTLRGYFINVVRARGPAPAFRIGQVPYGVLPALSVVNWQQRGNSLAEQMENAAKRTLLSVRETWKTAAQVAVPKVSANAGDPLADLLNVLALHPSARELYARQTTGSVAYLDLFHFLGADRQVAINEGKAIVADLLSRLAQPTWAQVPAALLTYSDQSKLVAIPLVAKPDQLFDDKPSPSLFAALNSATATQLVNDTVVLPPEVKETVYYKLARAAVLEAKIRKALDVAKNNGGGANYIFLEAAVLLSNSAIPFAPLLLTTSFAVTGGKPLGDSDVVKNDPQVAATITALSSLGILATVAEVDRLLSETLDVCSHRLDAWLTAYATRRLLEMRTAQAASGLMAPVGNYLGGYAFVENVRPVARQTTTVPGFGTVETQPGNGGYTHAPSLSHATASTILRNGYVSYADEHTNKYAFDLSSPRVRAAREVFEEMRAGQPLGAVIGYRFERAVQQRALLQPTLNLNQYRFALRNYFPLVANKAGGSTTVPTDLVAKIAARNVVDGLALWKAQTAVPVQVPWATAPDLPRPSTPAYNALVEEINKLSEPIDGVSDVATAEGLLQLARGNVTAAAGNLDALARGTPPPDPEVAVSQRGGTPATHRAAVVFTGAGIPISPGDGWVSDPTPRASASLPLDNWAGRILGNPSSAKAHITLDPKDPATGTATSVDISIGDLGLRPLDVVAIARASAAANAGSILDRRFAAAAAKFLADNDDDDHTVGAIAYSPATGPGSIPQVMEVARTLGALLGSARTLGADDVVASSDVPQAREDMAPVNKPLVDDSSDIATRGSDAINAVKGIIAALDSNTGLVAALVAAADYFPDAFPAVGATDESLAIAIAPSVSAELNSRVTAAEGAVATLAESAAGMAEQRVAEFKALFGNDFLVMPPFYPPNPAELGLSLSDGATLLPQPEDANAPRQFLQQAAQIYEGLGRFRTLSLYMGALNVAPQLRLDLAQLPRSPREAWIGLRFNHRKTAPLPPPLPGRQSLLLFSPSTLAPAASDIWTGFVIEDWVEVIPNATETTAVGFHFDNPGAEAGQAILVVPPSTVGGNWKPSDVWATLSETFDLATYRAVDLERVGGYGQFLPAIYVSNNVAVQTANTSLAASVFNTSFF